MAFMKLRRAMSMVVVFATLGCGSELDHPSPPLFGTELDAARARLEVQRSDLKAMLFPGGLPPGDTLFVRRDVVDPDFEALRESVRIDELVFDAGFGLRSRAYHFVPRRDPKRSSLIFNLGHGHGFSGESIVPLSVAAQGYPVLLLGMVLQGPNVDSRRLELPDGPLELSQAHRDLLALEHRGLNAMQPFLQPLARAVDYLSSRTERIVLAGISGGGWTVDLYSPLDPRVDATLSIAGSIPHELRVGGDLGDFEQLAERPVYELVSFQELYLLSAMERPHHQMFYERDNCCFAWSGRAEAFLDYAVGIQAELSSLELDPSAFELHFAPGDLHVVQPEAIELMETLLEAPQP